MAKTLFPDHERCLLENWADVVKLEESIRSARERHAKKLEEASRMVRTSHPELDAQAMNLEGEYRSRHGARQAGPISCSQWGDFRITRSQRRRCLARDSSPSPLAPGYTNGRLIGPGKTREWFVGNNRTTSREVHSGGDGPRSVKSLRDS
jgi:hypothetical protein